MIQRGGIDMVDIRLKAILGALLTLTGVLAAETNFPPLDARPWRIGLAPSHVTRPTNELFDRPQDWAGVASAIRIFKYYGVQLRPTGWAQPIQPKALADFANQRHLALACEFGSFSYGHERPAQIACQNAVAELQPVFDAGGTVGYLSLDGPDARLLKGKSKNPDALDLPQLAEEIALFYKLVREKYPNLKIGMLCNYPNWDFDAEHPGRLGGDTRATGVYVRQWFDALRAALEKQHDHLDYVEIDNPYGYFVGTQTHFTKKPMSGPANLQAIQDYCRKYGIPFWLVVNAEPKGPNAFEENTLDYITRLRQAGLSPDVFMIQSWYKQPAENVPEGKPGTFMHAADQIIHRIQALYPTPAVEPTR